MGWWRRISYHIGTVWVRPDGCCALQRDPNPGCRGIWPQFGLISTARDANPSEDPSDPMNFANFAKPAHG